MHVFPKVLLAALIAVAAGAAAAGEVYKWVDAQGNVHYGDKPKEGGEQVDVEPGSGTGEPADPEAAKAEAAHSAACEAKKKQLATYKNASTVKETDTLGRTREYSAEERQQLIAQTEKQVAEACAPPKPAAK